MTIPSWAVPGAKVVCVKATPWVAANYNAMNEDGVYRRPRFGDVVTICAVVSLPDGYWLTFIEHDELDAFAVRHFRPVVADDIEATLFRSKRQPVSREVEQA